MKRTGGLPARGTSLVDRVAERAPVAVLDLLGVWTISFHLSVVGGFGRDLAGGIFVIGVGAVALLRRRLGVGRRLHLAGGALGLAWLPVVVALVLVVLGVVLDPMGERRWVLYWAMAGVATAGLARWWLAGMPPEEMTMPAREREAGWRGSLTVHGTALAFGLGALLTRRPDADDALLVNQADWISRNPGPFPTRDVLFSDQVFPLTRPDFPRTAFEPLLGTLSAWTRVSAVAWFHLLVGPVVAAMAIWCLWRLFMSLGVRWPAGATLAAAVFLVLDGDSHASLGNFSFVRSWQGKSVLLLIILPTASVAGLRWARSGDHRALLTLVSAGLAGVGVSSSSLFLLPVVVMVAVVAGCADAVRDQWARRGAGALVAVSPIFVFGLLTALSPDQSSSGGPVGLAFVSPIEWVAGFDLPPAEAFAKVFGTGLSMALVLPTLLLAPLTVRATSSRIFLLLSGPVAFIVVYAPGTLDLLDSLSGAGSVLWRVAWLLNVPVAVGAVSTAWWGHGRRSELWLALGMPVVLAVSMLVSDSWVLDSRNTPSVGGIELDLPRGSEETARMILAHASTGDMVAGLEAVNWAVSSLDSRVYTVNPRGRYVSFLRSEPGFLADDRVTVMSALRRGLSERTGEEILGSLRSLSVDFVCLPRRDRTAAVGDLLVSAGWMIVDSNDQCLLFAAPGE